MPCGNYVDRVMTDPACDRIECDEIWAFCYSKAKNVPAEHAGEFGYGDVGIDADTKLVSTHDRPADARGRSRLHGRRGQPDGEPRAADDRLLWPLPRRVAWEFGVDVAFAQVKKTYVGVGVGPAQVPAHVRYSSSRCTGMDVRVRSGDPTGRCPHALRQAPTPHHAHGQAALYSAHQRVLQEARERPPSRSTSCTATFGGSTRPSAPPPPSLLGGRSRLDAD